jgi:hypothetical protein
MRLSATISAKYFFETDSTTRQFENNSVFLLRGKVAASAKALNLSGFAKGMF